MVSTCFKREIHKYTRRYLIPASFLGTCGLEAMKTAQAEQKWDRRPPSQLHAALSRDWLTAAIDPELLSVEASLFTRDEWA